MDNQLNYRQARQIRNRSVSDLIADEMIRGKGLGGAIGGAISLRTKARMKGIKEKFDILNMVRAVTGKSRLATSIIGRLFGRSREDIEYFAGRASPIGERRKKITGLSGQGEGEDTSGMKVVLNQILTFLQKSHEKDMVLREKENNLRESAKLKDDKRHNELLKALANVGFGGTGETATKEKEGGLLDGIMNFIRDILEKIKGLSDIISVLKDSIVKIAEKIGIPSVVRTLLGTLTAPAVVAGGAVIAGSLAIAGAAKYLQDKQIEKAADRGDVKEVSRLLFEQANPGEALLNMSPEDQISAKDDADKLAVEVVKAAQQKKNKTSSTNETTSTATPVKTENNATPPSTPELQFDAEGNVITLPPPPPAVNEAPKSSAVNTATDTNVSLNLSAPTSAERNQAAQNRTNVINTKAATGQKVPMHMVRNKEPTFQRMIYNSLRLV